MKRYLYFAIFTAFVTSPVFAQDAATQQQMDTLYGMIQDVQATQELQAKKMAELEKEIAELREKVNTPSVDAASSADLRNLAEKVQEIDKKRQADRDLILKQFELLAKGAGGTTTHIKPKPPVTDDPTPATPQKGYEYVVQANDTLSAIAKAYRDKGVKVTTTQILKANPGLDPTKLYLGKKVFIPDPNAK